MASKKGKIPPQFLPGYKAKPKTATKPKKKAKAKKSK
jgi:hypothetical protein